METNELIALEVFCQYCNVTVSFIEVMAEAGWIQIIHVDEYAFVHADQLAEAERVARLHNDLHINPEGIDVVLTLLQRIRKMEQEIFLLKNKHGHFNTE